MFIIFCPFLGIFLLLLKIFQKGVLSSTLSKYANWTKIDKNLKFREYMKNNEANKMTNIFIICFVLYFAIFWCTMQVRILRPIYIYKFKNKKLGWEYDESEGSRRSARRKLVLRLQPDLDFRQQEQQWRLKKTETRSCIW